MRQIRRCGPGLTSAAIVLALLTSPLLQSTARAATDVVAAARRLAAYKHGVLTYGSSQPSWPGPSWYPSSVTKPVPGHSDYATVVNAPDLPPAALAALLASKNLQVRILAALLVEKHGDEELGRMLLHKIEHLDLGADEAVLYYVYALGRAGTIATIMRLVEWQMMNRDRWTALCQKRQDRGFHGTYRERGLKVCVLRAVGVIMHRHRRQLRTETAPRGDVATFTEVIVRLARALASGMKTGDERYEVLSALMLIDHRLADEYLERYWSATSWTEPATPRERLDANWLLIAASVLATPKAIELLREVAADDGRPYSGVAKRRLKQAETHGPKLDPGVEEQESPD